LQSTHSAVLFYRILRGQILVLAYTVIRHSSELLSEDGAPFEEAAREHIAWF
jgi:hypothetical protein